jgi:hypothetical protein
VPQFKQTLEVKTMNEEFENFNDQDEEWLTELEIRATDLENELFDWREAHARELAETSYGHDEAPRRTRDARTGALRAQPREAQPKQAQPRQAQPRQAQPRQAQPRQAPLHGAQPGEALHHIIEDEDLDQEDELTTIIRTGPRPGWPQSGRGGPSARHRTQTLIEGGRRSASRARRPRSRKIVLGVIGLAVVVAIAAVFLFRSSPSWPPSVAVVQSEITTACQNPNVASEPGQVNFACDKTTSQVLWVFALMTSGDNPQFTDAKSGRQGLEPITPTQGGEVAWSLDLHHPYNPYDPVDSLAVAARAINNIIGGATLTSANGKPAVQPGLESDPGNCAKYTGSSAIVARAGFPSVCAQPVTTQTGQAALVADAYKQWVVGATAATAYDVSVLFANANDPGNAQVQAILKTLPGAR